MPLISSERGVEITADTPFLVDGPMLDSNGLPGHPGDVLVATVNGTVWTQPTFTNLGSITVSQLPIMDAGTF